MPHRVWKSYGVRLTEVRGSERLAASFAAGHGVVFAPNHCRPCDPEGSRKPRCRRPGACNVSVFWVWMRIRDGTAGTATAAKPVIMAQG